MNNLCPQGQHRWQECECQECGETRHEVDGCQCRLCHQPVHEFDGCTCAHCGVKNPLGHARHSERCVCIYCGDPCHAGEGLLCTCCGHVLTPKETADRLITPFFSVFMGVIAQAIVVGCHGLAISLPPEAEDAPLMEERGKILRLSRDGARVAAMVGLSNIRAFACDLDSLDETSNAPPDAILQRRLDYYGAISKSLHYDTEAVSPRAAWPEGLTDKQRNDGLKETIVSEVFSAVSNPEADFARIIDRAAMKIIPLMFPGWIVE